MRNVAMLYAPPTNVTEGSAHTMPGECIAYAAMVHLSVVGSHFVYRFT